MKIVDLNVLIYAVDETSRRHERSRSWLDRTISSTEIVGIPTAVAVGFVRLTTNARVVHTPLPIDTSVGLVRQWYRRPDVVEPQPTPGHYELLARLLEPVGGAGNLVSDAHPAALAIEHAAQLCSFDRDFGRFAGLRWIEPDADR